MGKHIRSLLRLIWTLFVILLTYFGGSYFINVFLTPLSMLTIGGILLASLTIVGLFLLWTFTLFVLLGD